MVFDFYFIRCGKKGDTTELFFIDIDCFYFELFLTYWILLRAEILSMRILTLELVSLKLYNVFLGYMSCTNLAFSAFFVITYKFWNLIRAERGI